MKKSKALVITLVMLLCFVTLAPSYAWAASLSSKYELKISGNYITGIPEKLLPADLISTMSSGTTVSFTNGVKKYVCTGCEIKTGGKTYTAVVLGDVDGSGTVDSIDYLKVKSLCVGAVSLEGAFYSAADVDYSGTITLTDYMRIKGHFVGTYDLNESTDDNTSSDESGEPSSETSSEASSEESSEASGDTTGGGTIHFTSTSVQVTGSGVSASGTTAIITTAGEYKVTGSCADGMILVQAGDEDNVKLNLSGVSLSSKANGPIFFETAKNGHIILADGTTNTLSDASTYTNGAKGTVFAECDLKIKGNGTLNVTGNYKHALASDDEIFFDGGNVNVVSAVNDGFHSNDGIYLAGGTATVKSAGSDGFESENVIEITGGTLNAAVTGEGAKAATTFTMTGGTVNVTSADNGIKSSDTASISGGTVKINCAGNGVKATNALDINGGTFTVTAGLDCFDCTGDSTLGTAGTLTVNNGNITASATGEGLQATYLYVKGGTVKVNNADNGFKGDSAAYVSGGVSTITCTGNGIKSDVYVGISGGEIKITSSMGDGVKASDGITVGKGDVDVTGGKLTITAKYDGIQADGNLTINNGHNGSSSGNVDSSETTVSTNLASKANGGSYVVSGGTVVTEDLYSDPTWSADSTGYGKGAINDGNWVSYTAGDWVEVKRSNGGVTVDFKLAKVSNIQNVVINMGMREGSSNRGLPDSVTVYTSTDGVNFNNVFGSIAGSSFGLYQDYGYSAVVAGNASNVKYVRLFMAGSTSGNYAMRIGEIEIYDGAIPSGTNVVIPDGYNITIATNGGASNKISANDTNSYKGIKGSNITIKNCNMYINASDDALHSDGSFTMTGGKVTAASGDDGIHAEATLTISGGEVEITQSNEGIEGLNIYVNGTAFVKVKSSDDGFNAAGGADGSGGWKPGPSASGNYSLNFGGDCFVYINANGDGLDSNGTMNVSGGKIFCEGPTNGGNSSMDHNGALKITGGLLLSLGSSGMANECLSNATTSTQCAFATNCSGSAGTTLAIKNSSGTVLCVFKTTKQFQHLVFSSSGLATGNTYQVLTGVTGVGENTCGYYPSNQYTGGSQAASVSQSSTIVGGGGGGMMPPGRPW